MRVLQIKLSKLDYRSLTTSRGPLTNTPAPYPRHLIRQKPVTHTSTCTAQGIMQALLISTCLSGHKAPLFSDFAFLGGW